MKQNRFLAWRDGSAVRNTCYSSEDPVLVLASTPGGTQSCSRITETSKDLIKDARRVRVVGSEK